MERVLGPEHPFTLDTRGGLALFTGLESKSTEARDQYAALLPIIERVLGPEHPSTLTIRGNLASWTGKAGDPVTARDSYAVLLPIKERIYGPDDLGHLGPVPILPGIPGRRASRSGPATNTPPFCPKSSTSTVPTTRALSSCSLTSPAGPEKRATQTRPGTNTPLCARR